MADTVIQPVRVGGSRPELRPENPSGTNTSILPGLSTTFASDDAQSAGAGEQDNGFARFPEPYSGLLAQAAGADKSQVR